MGRQIKVEALFISDVHLGSRGCNPKTLLNTLKKYKPKTLFIVGDFIDGWVLERNFRWSQDYTNVIRKILSYSKDGVNVIYISGNHDEFLRLYGGLDLGNIQIADDYIWNNYLIIHGDKFDGIVKLKWLGKLGAFGYELSVLIDRLFKKLGYRKSLANFLKSKVKKAVKFIERFENELIKEANKKECEGVICGHIHNPSDNIIDGIHYLNCGDWVSNNSYIIYNDNKFTLLYEEEID